MQLPYKNRIAKGIILFLYGINSIWCHCHVFCRCCPTQYCSFDFKMLPYPQKTICEQDQEKHTSSQLHVSQIASRCFKVGDYSTLLNCTIVVVCKAIVPWKTSIVYGHDWVVILQTHISTLWVHQSELLQSHHISLHYVVKKKYRLNRIWTVCKLKYKYVV